MGETADMPAEDTRDDISTDDAQRSGSFGLVSVVVPAFNEADSINELYERTKKALGAIGQKFEFILVDDGSTDATQDVVNALCDRYDNVVLVSHYHNHGKSMALMQGFDIARGDVAVMMDADLQDFPEMLPRLLEKLACGDDLVNGWRAARKDTFGKRLVSKVYNALTRKILSCSVHDINCGLKAMRRNVYKNLDLRGDLHRLIPALAASLGYTVDEVPVDHGDRQYGQSKYRLMRHRGILDIIIVAASQATRARPFHIFFELAVLILLGIGSLSFIGWLVVQIGLEPGGVSARIFGPMLGLILAWAVAVGTLLPLVGFVLEILTARFQDSSWRHRLIKQTRHSGQGDNNAGQ